jgi:glycosyltransferase involved in cell wall biosynthesis
MKILAIYPYVPWPLNRGAYHRAYHLLKGAAAEHRVDLLALSEKGEGADHAAVFREFCGEVHVISFEHPAWQSLFPKRLLNPLPATVAHWTIPGVVAKIEALLSRGDYDAVHVLDLVLAQFFLRDRPAIPLILDRTRVDLQYQWMEQKRMKFSFKTRLLNCESFAKLWAFEKAVARRCALQVVCGPDDETFIRKYISQTVPIEVIPNGVDLDFFHPDAVQDPRAADPTLIFCGAMDYNPNVDALRWFFSEMHEALRLRVPSLKVLLVGKDPGPEVRAYSECPGVTVTGGVPDVRPYYKRAWLQIVPLRIGGGTRLKIVESLGIGTPVISTRIGAQGLNLQNGHDILYAETPGEFIEVTSRALANSTLRRRLEANGRTSVVTRLGWPKLGRGLSNAYAKTSRIGFDAGDATRRSEPGLVPGWNCR